MVGCVSAYRMRTPTINGVGVSAYSCVLSIRSEKILTPTPSPLSPLTPPLISLSSSRLLSFLLQTPPSHRPPPSVPTNIRPGVLPVWAHPEPTSLRQGNALQRLTDQCSTREHATGSDRPVSGRGTRNRDWPTSVRQGDAPQGLTDHCPARGRATG